MNQHGGKMELKGKQLKIAQKLIDAFCLYVVNERELWIPANEIRDRLGYKLIGDKLYNILKKGKIE